MKQWMAGVALMTAVAAAPARAEDSRSARGWDGRVLITLNAGFQSAPEAFSYRDAQELFLEEASAEAEFQSKAAVSYEVGAALRVAGDFGIGGTVARFTEDQVSTTTLSIPHPLFFNQPAVDSIEAPTRRAETVVHLDAVYMLPIRGPWQIAVFGGPSYFELEQDVVRDVEGDLDFVPPLGMRLDLTQALIEPSRGSAWGYNLGAHLGYRLGRNVGVGTSVRYSSASIDVENAFEATRTEAPGGPVPVKVGGLTVTGGLQLRF